MGMAPVFCLGNPEVTQRSLVGYRMGHKELPDTDSVTKQREPLGRGVKMNP